MSDDYDDWEDMDDDDLMGGFDDYDDFDNPDADSGSRSPIADVAAGALDEAVSTKTANTVLRQMTKHSLPEGFNVALKDVDSVAGKVGSMYSEAVKDLEDPIKDLSKVVNKSIESATWLPEGMRKAISDATRVDETSYGGETVDPKELAIQAAQNEIFGKQLEQNASIAATDAELSAKTASISAENDASIINELRKINGYNQSILSDYQRKNLELQFRQYYALKDLVEEGRASNKDINSFLEAIVVNTGLPEANKIRLTENFSQSLEDQFVGGLAEDFSEWSNNFTDNVVGNAASYIKDLVSGTAEAASEAEDLRDSLAMMDDMPDSEKRAMLGGTIFDLVAPELAEAGAKKVKGLLKRFPKLKEYSNDLLYLSENAPGLIEQYVSDKAEDSEIFRIVEDFLPGLSSNDLTLTTGLIDSGNEIANFTKVESNSINVVIPGLLSRILRMNTILATGEDPGLTTYSLKSQDFQTSSEAKRLTMQTIDENTANNQRGIDKLLTTLDANGDLGEEDRLALVERLMEEISNNEVFNLDRISKESTDNKTIDDLFAKLNQEDSGTRSLVNREVANAYQYMARARSNRASDLDIMGNTGQLDILKEMGIVVQDERGRNNFNNDTLRDLDIANLDLGKKYTPHADNTMYGTNDDLSPEEEIDPKAVYEEVKENVTTATREAAESAKSTVMEMFNNGFNTLPPEVRSDLEKKYAESLKTYDEYSAKAKAEIDKAKAEVSSLGTEEGRAALADMVANSSVVQDAISIKDQATTYVRDGEMSNDAVMLKDAITGAVVDLREQGLDGERANQLKSDVTEKVNLAIGSAESAVNTVKDELQVLKQTDMYRAASTGVDIVAETAKSMSMEAFNKLPPEIQAELIAKGEIAFDKFGEVRTNVTDGAANIEARVTEAADYLKNYDYQGKADEVRNFDYRGKLEEVKKMDFKSIQMGMPDFDVSKIKTIAELKDMYKGSETEEFMSKLEAEITNAKDSLKESPLGEQLDEAIAQMDELLAKAKVDTMSTDNLANSSFVKGLPNVNLDTILSDLGITAQDTETPNRPSPNSAADRIKERVSDNGYIDSDAILSLSEAIKTMGKDIVQDVINATGGANDSAQGQDADNGGNFSAVNGSLEKLIGVNVQGFQENSALLASVQAAIVASALGDPGTNPATKDVLLNSMGNLIKKTGSGLGSFFTSYFNGASKLISATTGGLGNMGGKLLGGITGGLKGALSSSKSDIYSKGSNKAVLLAKKLIAGDYTDVSTGKTVRGVDDITGEVIDENGNVVLTEAEFAEGLFVMDKGGISGGLKMVSAPFRVLFNTHAATVNAVLAVPKFLASKVSSMWNAPYDVHVGGEEDPRLYKTIFNNGGYISKGSGKLIRHPDDIDGPVEDLEGNTVLSAEDIARGLFTRGGRRIGDSKLLGFSKSLLGGVAGVVKGAAGVGIGMAKAGIGLVTGAAGKLSGMAGQAFDKVMETKDVAFGTTSETLDLIYGHMVSKWPIGANDSDGDVTDEELQVRQAEALETIAAATSGGTSALDSDGDGDRDGGWRDQLANRRRRKPKDEKEEKASKEKKEGGGIFGLISGLVPFISTITSGITGLLGLLGGKKALDFLSGGADALDIDMPDSKKGGGKGPKGPKGGKFGKLASKGGKLLKGAAGLLSRQAIKKGATALAGGAAALMGGVGATVIAPLIAVAGAGYTAFEIGRYAWSRSDLEEMERLRFLQYGVGEDYDLISEIRYMESDLIDEIEYSDKPSLNLTVREIVEEYSEEFGCTTQAEKEQFNMWIAKRFLPVFLVNAQVIHMLDSSVDLGDIDDELSDKTDRVTFIKRACLNSKALTRQNVYGVTATPMPTSVINSNMEEVMAYAKTLVENMGATLDTAKPLQPTKKDAAAVNIDSTKLTSVRKATQANNSKSNSINQQTGLLEMNKLGAVTSVINHIKPANGSVSEEGDKVVVKTDGVQDVYVTADGEVVDVTYNRKMGRLVRVLHDDGSLSTYSGLGTFNKDVQVGTKVGQGDIIGTSGKMGKGSGLTWELRESKKAGGRPVNASERIGNGKVDLSVGDANIAVQSNTTTKHVATNYGAKLAQTRPGPDMVDTEAVRTVQLNKAQSRASNDIVSKSFNALTKASSTRANSKVAREMSEFEKATLSYQEVMVTKQDAIIEQLTNLAGGLSGSNGSNTNSRRNSKNQTKTFTTPVNVSKTKPTM